MNTTSQSGFGLVGLIIIIGLCASSFYIYDETGVSYGQKAVDAVKYYTIDRNTDAMEKAKDAQNTMQQRQLDIQAEITR